MTCGYDAELFMIWVDGDIRTLPAWWICSLSPSAARETLQLDVTSFRTRHTHRYPASPHAKFRDPSRARRASSGHGGPEFEDMDRVAVRRCVYCGFRPARREGSQ